MVQMTTGSLGWIDRVVVHELAHQVFYFALRKALGFYGELYHLVFLPTWFVEGFAQYEAEEWDKNREFFLKSCYNKFFFLDREHLYGFMGKNYVRNRLVYEQGHALYRSMAQAYGRDIGGKILSHLSLLRPDFNGALKKAVGMDERTLMLKWRLFLEQDYPLKGTGNRVSGYADEISAPVSRIIDQVFYLKRAGRGFVFTGLARADVYEKNLYYYSPAAGLVKLDGPEIGTFFSLSADRDTVYYAKKVRHKTGALLYVLHRTDLKGRRRTLSTLGEEPCVAGPDRIVFVRHRAGLSALYACGVKGDPVKRIPLPASVAQVFKPEYALGRIYFSFVDFEGARKAGSVLPGGNGFCVEAEMENADVRFPAVSARGQLAFASNAAGPFNVYLRDSAGVYRQLTADPYGVFAPAFDGPEDSLSVISLRDEGRNFNLSCFAVSVSRVKEGEAWHMDLPWKKSGRVLSGPLPEVPEDEFAFSRPSAYSGLSEIRPLVIYPFFKDRLFDFSSPGIRAVFGDPLEKHMLSGGPVYYFRNGKPGFEFRYGNHTFYPDIYLGAGREYIFKQETFDDYKAFETEKRDHASAEAVFPLDFFESIHVSQAFIAGISAARRHWRDSIYFPSTGYAAGQDRGISYDEVPLSLGYRISTFRPFTGNFVHPLNATLFSLNFSVADKAWKSDYAYKTLGAGIRNVFELGRTRQAVYNRLYGTALIGETITTIVPGAHNIPRGKPTGDFDDIGRFLSYTFEYRLPLVRDLGFSLMGLYFEMLTVAPFFDAFAYDPAGTPFSDFPKASRSAWTAGLQARQRIFFCGKHIGEYGFFTAYDPDPPGQYVFFFNASSGF
jgi:hypothetical protein